MHVYRNTPVYLGHCFLSSSVQADFVSSCLPVLIRRWSSRFCPPPCFLCVFFLMLWHRVLFHITLACALALIWIFLCAVDWLCIPAQWLLLQDYWKTEHLLSLSSFSGRAKKLCRFPQTLAWSVGLTAWLCCLGKVTKSYSWCGPIKKKKQL